MKPIDRSKRAGAQLAAPRHTKRRASGFTLIELMIAITIMAIVAILAWRGLDQIIRGREVVTATMTNERVLAQAFDQIGSDTRAAAQDDEVGQSGAIQVGDSGLQVVRYVQFPQQAPRLQVVRYRLIDGRLWRIASPPLSTVGALRSTLRNRNNDANWSRVALIAGIDSLQSRGWVDDKGWTANDADLRDATGHALAALRNPVSSDAPLFRAVRGVRVTLGLRGDPTPFMRTYLVGE